MAISSRPYASEDDYTRMRELLIDIYAASGPPVYCTIGDLDWWRASEDDPGAIAKVQLWFGGDDQLIGFAWPGGTQVDLMVHPRHQAIEDEMLAWAEQQIPPAGAGEAASLRAWADESDGTRIATFQRRGYSRADTHLCYRSRELGAPLPELALPPGYLLRHVEGEADLEQRVAVHRDAFAPSRMTVDKHRRAMRSPTYRPELDLVVVAPDGTFAAFCIVWFDARNRLGVFEPVGCHSAHRRRGLTRAMMYEGMRRLVALGARTASVMSLGGAEPANGLYESVGAQVLDRVYAWTKILE